MPEPPTNSEPVVYQLRVALRGISPLIWRRLLVRSDSTMADLHATFQRVLGWTDEHLNRFVIHGREYGVGMMAGSASVTIPDTYAWPTWACAFVSASCTSMTSPTAGSTTCESSTSCRSEPGRYYPVCIGGRRAAPPEDCGGPWAFLELRQHYSVFRIADRLLELLKPLTVANDRRGEDGDDDDDDGNEHDGDDDAVNDHSAELGHLLRWLKIDRFDRRAANRELARVAAERVA